MDFIVKTKETHGEFTIQSTAETITNNKFLDGKKTGESPFLDVYFAVIPKDVSITSVTPKARNEEIASCSDEKVRKEKFYSWQLLSHALYNSLGLRIENLDFIKQENGKWLCDKCFFSISHGNGVVVVAVSSQSVGIDLELIDQSKKQVLEKVLTDREKTELSSNENLIEKLTTIWAKKESIYKMEGRGAFNPKKIESSLAQTFSKIIKINEKDFAFAICSNHLTNLRFITL
jgi:phosphopantetheinyl transferase